MKFIIALLLFGLTASAQVNVSPNMGLPIPIPGITPGPQWAGSINASLMQIDGHNHSSGQGVQVHPNGLNIDSDLSFHSNDATALRSSRYTPQTVPITNASPDIGAVYVSGNELFYNDVSGGNQVQLTLNGSVNGSPGSITGLPSGTASASYSAGTFVWQSATNTAAVMDAGSIIIRNTAASAKGLTLNPPAAMANNISETLPTIPAGTSFMTMDASGNMLTTIATAAGITQSNLAANSVGTTQLIDASVTLAKIATPLSVTTTQDITSSGSLVIPAGVKMIYVQLCSGGGGGAGGGGAGGSSSGGGGGGYGSLLTPVIGIPVNTAGETLTVTIGAGGAGGAGGATSGVTAPSGSSGGVSKISRSGTTLLSSFTTNNAVGGSFSVQGAGGGTTALTINGTFVPGGAGGQPAGSGANNSVAGTNSELYAQTGGAAGGSASSGTCGAGGGGGGASSLASGGAGGLGPCNATGGAGSVGGRCAGGGGGSGINGTHVGGAGAAGGGGLARVTYTVIQ